jgi:two-component system C4-dicarboxylate transport sensor histidine kinase DctB
MAAFRRFLVPALVVLLALAAAVLAGAVARQVLLDRLETRAMQDLRLRQALLTSEIARFRLLPRALADDRDLVAAAQSDAPAARAALNRKLEALAQEFGAAAIYAIDARGLAFGASNWRRPESFIGRDYTFRPISVRRCAMGRRSSSRWARPATRPGSISPPARQQARRWSWSSWSSMRSKARGVLRRA